MQSNVYLSELEIAEAHQLSLKKVIECIHRKEIDLAIELLLSAEKSIRYDMIRYRRLGFFEQYNEAITLH